MSAIPQGVTHLEVTDNGANFWSITEPDDGTGEVWLGGKWMASEISDRLMQRLMPVTGTPSHRWTEDPHAGQYDGERADLTLGDFTDDELANAVFMHGNEMPDIGAVLAGKAKMPIVYLTAAKERIRWLSRRLDATLKALAMWDRPEPWGANDVIPLGEGSITGEAYRRGVEAGRRTPIRVVADVSGGALHGVYAEVPVRVLFISDDADDVSAMEENLGEDGLHRDTNGNLVASWYLASNGGADAEVVQHYFEQE